MTRTAAARSAAEEEEEEEEEVWLVGRGSTAGEASSLGRRSHGRVREA
jgi:hypothetical protein